MRSTAKTSDLVMQTASPGTHSNSIERRTPGRRGHEKFGKGKSIMSIILGLVGLKILFYNL